MQNEADTCPKMPRQSLSQDLFYKKGIGHHQNCRLRGGEDLSAKSKRMTLLFLLAHSRRIKSLIALSLLPNKRGHSLEDLYIALHQQAFGMVPAVVFSLPHAPIYFHRVLLVHEFVGSKMLYGFAEH